jgi:hypothetical protein
MGAQRYAQLADCCRVASQEALIPSDRYLLERLEHTYRVLAPSCAVLERSLKLQQKLGPREQE